MSSVRDRALVITDGIEAVRRGELAGLQWQNCLFDQDLFHIQISVGLSARIRWNETKTPASEALIPMHAAVKEALLASAREETPYAKPTDFVFPSVRGANRGKKPLTLRDRSSSSPSSRSSSGWASPRKKTSMDRTGNSATGSGTAIWTP